MANAKSQRALTSEAYTFFDDKRYGKAYWAFNTEHRIFKRCNGDIRKILHVTSRMNSFGFQVPSDLCWRRVKDPTKYGEECYFPLTSFKPRDESPTEKNKKTKRYFTWDPSLVKEKTAKQGETRDKYRAKNLPFFRMYMMGDSAAPIWCPIEKINIDFQEFWDTPMNNCWQQHHFVFFNGTSLQKDGDDPGRNNCSTDLTELGDKSRKVLEDTARTIFLSATAHDKIHKVRTQGDIKDYSIDQLPWALRCEKNWNKFRSYVIEYGHDFFPNYQTWMASLVLEANLKRKSHIDPRVQPA